MTKKISQTRLPERVCTHFYNNMLTIRKIDSNQDKNFETYQCENCGQKLKILSHDDMIESTEIPELEEVTKILDTLEVMAAATSDEINRIKYKAMITEIRDTIANISTLKDEIVHNYKMYISPNSEDFETGYVAPFPNTYLAGTNPNYSKKGAPQSMAPEQQMPESYSVHLNDTITNPYDAQAQMDMLNKEEVKEDK